MYIDLSFQYTYMTEKLCPKLYVMFSERISFTKMSNFTNLNLTLKKKGN